MTKSTAASLPQSEPIGDTERKAAGLIIFIHGGAWRSGDKSEHTVLASHLSSLSKMPVAVPNYRLSPRQPPPPDSGIATLRHPTHTQDIVLALETIKVSQQTISVADTSRLFLVGHSCGAHMIASLVLDPPGGEGTQLDPPLSLDVYQSIKGLVAAEGIYDLMLLLKTFPDYRDFVEGAFPTTGSLEEYSVSRYLCRSGTAIPWLLIQSPGDTLIDTPQAEAMYQHLRLEYERNGWDTNLIRRDFESVKGDHDELLSTLDFAKLVVSIL
ncbi:Kynurenine formamidase [Serendipita sp. 397]|nr:Kynurenine formamidase [Serendipita sp. 397]